MEYHSPKYRYLHSGTAVHVVSCTGYLFACIGALLSLFSDHRLNIKRPIERLSLIHI